MSNTYEVSESAWHYRFINQWFSHSQFERDFCTYWRYFSLSVMILTVFTACVLAAVIVLPLSVVVVLVNEPTMILLIPFGYILNDVLRNGIPGRKESVKMIKVEKAKKESKSPSIFSAKLSSMKDKMCPQLIVIK